MIEVFIEIGKEIDAIIDKRKVKNIFVRALASNDDIFLAKMDGVFVGYVWFSINKDKKNKKFCKINDISIKENFKENEVISGIFQFIKDYAKKKNCEIVQAEIPKQNQDSINFFEKFGFKDRYVVVELKL